jgi:alkylated DNA repair dioxygenase AlkB
MLRDGDFVVMGGAVQKTHTHEVPDLNKKELSAVGSSPFKGKRINITLRLMK